MTNLKLFSSSLTAAFAQANQATDRARKDIITASELRNATVIAAYQAGWPIATIANASGYYDRGDIKRRIAEHEWITAALAARVTP